MADDACPILWRGPSNIDRSVVPMAGVAADGRFLPAAQALGVRFYFGEPFSRRRRVVRFRFTATEGPSGGLMNCAYVGLCVKDVADDASCQVQELDAMFLSSAGFGYGRRWKVEARRTSSRPPTRWTSGSSGTTGGRSARIAKFIRRRGTRPDRRRFQRLNLRRLLRRDAGEVGLVPVVGVPRDAKAMVGSLKNRRIERFMRFERRRPSNRRCSATIERCRAAAGAATMRTRANGGAARSTPSRRDQRGEVRLPVHHAAPRRAENDTLQAVARAPPRRRRCRASSPRGPTARRRGGRVVVVAARARGRRSLRARACARGARPAVRAI